MSSGLAAFCVLAGCGGGGTGSQGGSPPPPKITLTDVGPLNSAYAGGTWVVAGGPSFTLLASGSGFTSTSEIQWNGQTLATMFGSDTNLSATVPDTLVANPGTASIAVSDSSSGVTSNALPFGIASPATKTAGVIQMITVAPDGSPANSDSLVAPSISTTGRYVAFQSNATNLVAGVSSSYEDIFERDTCIGAPSGCTPSTILISSTYDGSPVDGQSRDSAISGNGRYVSFDSSADNILPNTSICPISACVFLRDTCIGAPSGCAPTTTLISIAMDGTTADGGNPAITPDARYVTFESSSPDVADGNPGGYQNIFERDTCIGAPAGCTSGTVLISQSSSGVVGNENSHPSSVSSDGRFVAFQSYSTNLVPNDTSVWSDIFVRDTCIGAPVSCIPSTTRESVSTDGTQENNGLDYEVVPSISSDGRLVAWASTATNMVAQNVNGHSDIYLRDTCTGAPVGCTPTTSLASLGNDGSIPNFGQNNQSMSADGRFVAFASLASNLVPGDTVTPGTWKDIFVRDTCFGASAGCKPSTVRVSVAITPYDTQSNAINDLPRISGDGHYIVFMSAATNYLSDGGNGHEMVYLAKTGF
jgi:trimeric autotransporter adhesin